MRLRALSVALLAGVVLVPVSASAAVAAGSTTGSTVSAVSKTYKNSHGKRAKRAARTGTTVSAPRTSAVTAPTTDTAPLAPAPVVGPGTTVSYADRVLALTNAERTRRGLRALAFSGCADGYADSWARALSQAGSLSHQPLAPVLTACGARGVGENVAFGNVTPEQLVAMWMASTGHRTNILNAGFTHLGVGDVTTSTGRVYGVQVFLTL
jgi:uncharacterized protein YkwD